jgi:hypothetical protein
MNRKFYVSLEAAMLLKEKGYNEATDYIIDEDSCMMNSHYLLNEYLSEYVYSCPSKAEAIDWLESKGIIVEFQYYQEFSTWNYAIYCICYMNFDEEFSTRLEAEEAAIIKALELL